QGPGQPPAALGALYPKAEHVRPQPVLPLLLPLLPLLLALPPGPLPLLPLLLRFLWVPLSGVAVLGVTVPERVLRHIPNQQQEGPPCPPAVLLAVPRAVGCRLAQILPCPAHHVGVRHPDAQAQVRQGEHDPVRAAGRPSHQGREGGTAD